MIHFNEEEIRDFFYEELDKEKHLEISKHVETCHECSKILKKITSFSGLLSLLEPVQSPEISFEHLFKKETMARTDKSVYLIFSLLISGIFSILYLFQAEIVYYIIPDVQNILSSFIKPDPFLQSILTFFIFGTAISLSIAPILKKECETNYTITR